MTHSRYNSNRAFVHDQQLQYSKAESAVRMLSAAFLGIWSMSVIQTIGRLCQPAQDVLGGLLVLDRHFNFPSAIFICHQPLLYTRG